MLKLLLSGCLGKMGRVITETVNENPSYRIVAGIDINAWQNIPTDFPVFASPEEAETDAEVIIDFSHHTALEGLLKFAVARRLPIVVSTTGHTEEELALMQKASREIPIFYSRNMSLGINVLSELVKKAAASLPGFDIEIVEQHHNRKLDAPSGTALMLADAAKEGLDREMTLTYERQSKRAPRDPNEIGIHSVRGGTIVGEHQVIFAGPDEVITLSHSAASREVFAQGALHAANYLLGKQPGIYNMTDLVSEMLHV